LTNCLWILALHWHNTKGLAWNATFINRPEAGMNEVLILSTTDTLERAQEIASALVEAREAACITIVPGIRSIYRWEGKLCNEGEFLLLIKSSMERFEAVRDRIRRLHSYEVPEIIALPLSAGDPDYLNWLRSSLV
jgi:periplasmic divalent cation tolerance protein